MQAIRLVGESILNFQFLIEYMGKTAICFISGVCVLLYH